MERPLLKVHRTTRIQREAVGRVMRVGRIEAVENSFLHVVLVVTVSVLQKYDVRSLSQQYAVIPELEAGEVV